MLQEEHSAFRDLADKMMEEKDTEISRLLDDNKNLLQLLDSRPSVCPSSTHYLPDYLWLNLVFSQAPINVFHDALYV